MSLFVTAPYKRMRSRKKINNWSRYKGAEYRKCIALIEENNVEIDCVTVVVFIVYLMKK